MTEPALALHSPGNTRRAATKRPTTQQPLPGPAEAPAGGAGRGEMIGPTVSTDWFDLALPPEGDRLDAGTVSVLIGERRPALVRILQEFRVPPEEAPALLGRMTDLLFSRWHELRDPAAWLVPALRACCIEHRCRLPQGAEGGAQADAGGSAAEEMDAGWVAGGIAGTGDGALD